MASVLLPPGAVFVLMTNVDVRGPSYKVRCVLGELGVCVHARVYVINCTYRHKIGKHHQQQRYEEMSLILNKKN